MLYKNIKILASLPRVLLYVQGTIAATIDHTTKVLFPVTRQDHQANWIQQNCKIDINNFPQNISERKPRNTTTHGDALYCIPSRRTALLVCLVHTVRPRVILYYTRGTCMRVWSRTSPRSRLLIPIQSETQRASFAFGAPSIICLH